MARVIGLRNIFIIVIIFHCINNFIWFKNDGYVQHGCHSVWLEKNSFEYSEVLRNNKTSFSKKILETIDFFKLSRYDYAFSASNFNLTSFFIALPISAPFNGHLRIFLINSILFLQFLLVLFAIYYLGKTLFNKTVGIWSGIIFSFYPGIFGISRKVNSELMVIFFVILSIILFLKKKNIHKVLWPFFLTIVFVLGMLSGSLFLVFFILLFLLHLFCDIPTHIKKESLYQLVIFLCFVLLFFNFYLDGEYARFFLNLKEGLNGACQKLFFQSSNFMGSAADGIIESYLFAPQDSFCPCTQTTNVGMNIKTFLFYIMEMIYYVSPLFFFLAFLSFFYLLRDKKVDFYKKLFLGSWLVFGYLLLSLFDIKWGKFITLVLPVFALSSGVFICSNPKKIRAKGVFIILMGAITVIYYSYFAQTHIHFLEKLNEGIISHRPIKSRFVKVSEQIAARIDNDDVSGRMGVIKIALLDQESSRFQGGWVADQSVRVDNLIRMFLKKRNRMTNFWRLSDDFYNTLDRQNFLIIVTQQKIKGLKDYLYPKVPGKWSRLNFEIVYDDRLKKGVYIYLVKILNI